MDEEFLERESLKDEEEKRKKRSEFEFASDIIVENCAVPFSIWVEPNSNVKKIIAREVDYDSLPYDELNEVEKGYLFEDQIQFIKEKVAENKIMLCEALRGEPCLKEACHLFETKRKDEEVKPGFCREFKICFEI